MIKINFKKGFKAVAEISTAIESLEDNKEYVCEIKEHKIKRSLTQNHYFWSLINQLSIKMNIDNIEKYKEYIKHYGLFRDIQIEEKAVKTMETVWNAYGIGWFCEVVDTVNELTTLRLYYGSSAYNSKQMSTLIEALRQDCESVGISVLTPYEVSLLKNEVEK